MLISSAFAQAAGAASSGSSLTGMIVQLLLIFAIFLRAKDVLALKYSLSKNATSG